MRSHWLALLCVLAPLILGFGALSMAALLLPQQVTRDVKLKYQFVPAEALVKSGTTTERALPGKEPETDAVKPDPAILLPARDIHGRILYAIASGFLYLASACAFAFGFAVLAREDAAPKDVAPKDKKMALLVALAFPIIAYLIVMAPSAIEQLRPLVVEGILDAAPSALLGTNESIFQRFLVTIFFTSGSGLSATVIALVRLNSVIGFASVGMLLSALASVSVLRGDEMRTREKALKDLQDRLMVIRVVLGLGAVLLVIAVAASKLLIQWSTSLLTDPQQIAIAPLGNALNQLFGAICTLVLISAVTPALVAFFLDRRRFYQRWFETAREERAAVTDNNSVEHNRPSAERVRDNLGFGTIAGIGSVIGVFAPLMTPHAIELLSGLVEVSNAVHRAAAFG